MPIHFQGITLLSSSSSGLPNCCAPTATDLSSSRSLSLASNACPHPRCRQRFMSAGKEGAARTSSVRALDGGPVHPRHVRRCLRIAEDFHPSFCFVYRVTCYTVAEPRAQCGAQRQTAKNQSG